MKRIIALFVTIVIIAMVLTGCGATEITETGNISTSITNMGDYLIFQTKDINEYFDFMEGLDRTKYEIIGISTSEDLKESDSSVEEFYVVRYKEKSE